MPRRRSSASDIIFLKALWVDGIKILPLRRQSVFTSAVGPCMPPFWAKKKLSVWFQFHIVNSYPKAKSCNVQFGPF